MALIEGGWLGTAGGIVEDIVINQKLSTKSCISNSSCSATLLGFLQLLLVFQTTAHYEIKILLELSSSDCVLIQKVELRR